MNRKITLSFFSLLFLSLVVLSQPTGFDISYHLFYLQNAGLDIYFNKPHFIYGYDINRYVLLSESLSLIPFPPLISIAIITSISWFYVLYTFFNSSNFIYRLAICISFYFLIFWTPVTISIGFLISSYLLVARNKFTAITFWILSPLFHPISIILFFLFSPFLWLRIRTFSLVCFLIFSLIHCFMILSVSHYFSYYKNNEVIGNISENILPFENSFREGLVPCSADALSNHNERIEYCYPDSDDSGNKDDVNLTQELRAPFEVNSIVEVIYKLMSKVTIITLFTIVIVFLFFSSHLDKYVPLSVKKMQGISVTFPLFVLLILLAKGYQNGSGLMSLINAKSIVESNLPIDNSIVVSLNALGYNVEGRTMLVNYYSNCFIVNSRFVNKELYSFDNNIACIKLVDFSDKTVKQCLINNPYQHYIEYSKYKGFIFNRLTAYSPDYNSLACTRNAIDFEVLENEKLK